jgi:hypothetical protein
VLILDVGSLSYQGNHPVFPPFNGDGCADACARTPGCNAWTYCGKKEGCGSGCKSFTKQHPQRKLCYWPCGYASGCVLAWQQCCVLKNHYG